MCPSTAHLGFPRLAGAGSFLLALIVTSIGWGLYGPVSLLYFHLVVGMELPVVGLALSAATLIVLPVPALAGVLVDRYGARRIVIVGELLQGIGFLGYLGVSQASGIAGLFAAALIVALGQRLYWSSYFTLVADIAPPAERDRWYGLSGAAQATGVGIGGAVIGLLVASVGTTGYTLAVAVNGLSSLVAAGLLVTRLREPRRLGSNASATGGYGPILADRPFVLLILVNVVFAVCSIMLSVGVPVYVTEALAAPGWVVGALFTFNTVLLAVAQTTVVRLLEPFRRTRAMILGGVFWAIWCGLLSLGLLVPRELLVAYLFAVMTLMTMAELIHAPTSSALSAAASPEDMRGRYLAAFQFSWSIAMTLTPGVFTLLYATSPTLPWLAVGVLALAASAGVLRLEPHLPPEAVRRPAIASNTGAPMRE